MALFQKLRAIKVHSKKTSYRICLIRINHLIKKSKYLIEHFVTSFTNFCIARTNSKSRHEERLFSLPLPTSLFNKIGYLQVGDTINTLYNIC